MLVAAGAVLSLVLAQRHDQGSTSGDAQYVCPMHLEVRSRAPGECPICGMALVKPGTFSQDAADDAVAAAHLLSQAAGGASPHLVGYYPSPVRQHVLRYDVYAPAWLESAERVAALVYSDQIPTLEPAEAATFSPTATPGIAVDVRASSRPVERWDRSMSLVRFDLAPARPALEPGVVGWVRFSRRPRLMQQVIPAGAVLESPEGPYALALSPDRGTFTKRPIEIGRTVTGWSAVLSGLGLREQVVSVNAFFWDAERRLQAGQRAGGETP